MGCSDDVADDQDKLTWTVGHDDSNSMPRSVKRLGDSRNLSTEQSHAIAKMHTQLSGVVTHPMFVTEASYVGVSLPRMYWLASTIVSNRLTQCAAAALCKQLDKQFVAPLCKVLLQTSSVVYC